MEGLINLSHVPTGDQLANMLTKPLTSIIHHSILSKLGVSTPPNLRGLLELQPVTALAQELFPNVTQAGQLLELVTECNKPLFLFFASSFGR